MTGFKVCCTWKGIGGPESVSLSKPICAARIRAVVSQNQRYIFRKILRFLIDFS
jgi:hypothetical protein